MTAGVLDRTAVDGEAALIMGQINAVIATGGDDAIERHRHGAAAAAQLHSRRARAAHSNAAHHQTADVVAIQPNPAAGVKV